MTWQHEPRLQAPAKYRRACRYDAFIPEPLLGIYQPHRRNRWHRNGGRSRNPRAERIRASDRLPVRSHRQMNRELQSGGTALLASDYLAAVDELARSWRAQFAASPGAPRSGAAAWAIIEVLPARVGSKRISPEQ